MKTSLALAATAMLAALGASGAAQAQTYVDLNVGASIFDEPDTTAATGRIGANFTPNFGAEGEISLDLGGDEFDNVLGIFARGGLPLNDQFEFIGRVGYARAEGNGPGDDGGVALGAGGVWMLDGRNGLRFDYTRYDFGDDANAISVTYVRRLY
ncbi:MAG: outer membrane beta-barrel protein [Maricaulaceae bacterium]|jgi:hypothetical protein